MESWTANHVTWKFTHPGCSIPCNAHADNCIEKIFSGCKLSTSSCSGFFTHSFLFATDCLNTSKVIPDSNIKSLDKKVNQHYQQYNLLDSISNGLSRQQFILSREPILYQHGSIAPACVCAWWILCFIQCYK